MDVFDISEVARRTGMTTRALRFYEARGLIRPLRSAGGRRLFGAGELARLHVIAALKRGGFTLAEIARMLAGREVDLARLVTAQIAALEAQARQVAEAMATLQSVKSRIDRGEPIDVATLCSLIRQGDMTMEQENWRAVSDRYMTDEAKTDFAASYARMPADFDQAAYSAKWADLAGRIEAALPLDPASAKARAFHDEWTALLAPFTAVATPAMGAAVTRMYDDIDRWKGDQQPPFSSMVWNFIKQVGAARQAAG
jgi:MerR family transcriptional regulator, thiopeptide resistance regulator